MSVKDDYICGTCKHQKSCPQAWSFDKQDLDNIDQTTCGEWTDPNEVELTDEEKRGIVGDKKAHEIMEKEGRIV